MKNEVIFNKNSDAAYLLFYADSLRFLILLIFFSFNSKEKECVFMKDYQNEDGGGDARSSNYKFVAFVLIWGMWASF